MKNSNALYNLSLESAIKSSFSLKNHLFLFHTTLRHFKVVVWSFIWFFHFYIIKIRENTSNNHSVSYDMGSCPLNFSYCKPSKCTILHVIVSSLWANYRTHKFHSLSAKFNKNRAKPPKFDMHSHTHSKQTCLRNRDRNWKQLCQTVLWCGCKWSATWSRLGFKMEYAM